MMPVSCYLCIFLNVGLGEAAKRDVGTGSGQIPDMSRFASALSSSGYQKLPSGLIIQWGAAVAGIGGTGGTGNVVSFPVAFPRYCAQIITSYDNGSSSIIAGAAGNQTTTQFLLRCGATGGSYNFRWLAVGY
ncbi:gp53-like domain-containing protein [Escherichia coli]|uniref:gp53-like domain-containing protein n=1 Tax=Escherichia coli TaxID=562 RepID=UPI0039C8AD8B